MKILITGATSGIGYNLAKELIKRRHIVYITVHHNKEIKLVRRKLKKDNILKNVYVFKMDITNKKDLSLIDDLDIDVLVNQAGIGIGGSILDIDIKDNLVNVVAYLNDTDLSGNITFGFSKNKLAKFTSVDVKNATNFSDITEDEMNNILEKISTNEEIMALLDEIEKLGQTE